MNAKKHLLSLAGALLAGSSVASTPNVQVSIPELSATANLEATVTLIPMQTAAPTSALFLKLPTDTTSGTVTFTNVPQGRYRVHLAGSGIADFVILVPNQAGAVDASEIVESGWTAPAARAVPGQFRGVPYLWPSTNGVDGQALCDNGHGALYWGGGASGGFLRASSGVMLGDQTDAWWGATDGSETFLSFHSVADGDNASSQLYMEVADSTDENVWSAYTVQVDTNRVSLNFRAQGGSSADLIATGDGTGTYLLITDTSTAIVNLSTNEAFFKGPIRSTAGYPTNAANFTITTNDFALNTYYTNVAQRAFVSAVITMTNVNAGDQSKLSLFVDQDGDGTWEKTGITARLQGVALLSGNQELSTFLQPNARFLFTNQSSGSGAAALVSNSSQWTKQ